MYVFQYGSKQNGLFSRGFLLERLKCPTRSKQDMLYIYTEGSVAERAIRKWFTRFKAGYLNVQD